MNPPDLIAIARQLAVGSGRPGRPRQTDLCRAISAAYYALFHTLAQCGADLIAGATRAGRSQPAWEQTYRALDHGHAMNQCRNRSVMRQFPQDVQQFGNHFAEMQRYRHYADYAPATDFDRFRVVRLVDQTHQIISQFNSVTVRDRRAFAIYVLFRTRRD